MRSLDIKRRERMKVPQVNLVANQKQGAWEALWLSACLFDGVAELLQGGHQQFPVLALDLDHPIFDGAACAAFLFQLRRQVAELIRCQRKPGDHCYAAAFPALGLPPDPDNAVTLAGSRFLRAGAGGGWPIAAGTHPAMLGGIDQTGL